jgi:hypothetical protein
MLSFYINKLNPYKLTELKIHRINHRAMSYKGQNPAWFNQLNNQ